MMVNCKSHPVEHFKYTPSGIDGVWPPRGNYIQCMVRHCCLSLGLWLYQCRVGWGQINIRGRLRCSLWWPHGYNGHMATTTTWLWWTHGYNFEVFEEEKLDHFKSFETIWDYLGILNTIWDYWGPFGTVVDRFEPVGNILNHLGSFWTM